MSTGEFRAAARRKRRVVLPHFRATKEYSAISLRALYVNKSTHKPRTYPEDMGPPPEWAHETPYSFRESAMRMFEANVKSAFSNKRNGNINKFRIRFASKKLCPDFTFSANGGDASIGTKGGNFYLSIPKLKNICVKMDALVDISCEIDILYRNGFWYVAVPETVEPALYEYNKACIALDPGIKAFMTGIDLRGITLEFGRETKTRLLAVRGRASEAQSVMAAFKKNKSKSRWWQYRAYTRAKRTFMSCTAKLKNLVKDLHYKTCAYLTKHYDVILLPLFKTKEMLQPSTARSHGLNQSMLSLNHYQFRLLLQAKCNVQGKLTVVCSEMYTSQTCGRYYRLHARLGSNDLFVCPHYNYRASRDANAALNNLRFVCAGSLQIFS